MAKRQPTNRQPNNAAGAPSSRKGSKDSGKDKYPLLSGVDMKEGVGARPGSESGLFSATGNDIGDIHSILLGMEGKTDNRESIPSPFSQTEAFQITLRDYAGQEKSRITEGQWRGAMCLALLYPILLHGKQEPYWHQGTLKKNIRFIRLVDACRDQHSMELYTLCVTHKKKPYPLLYISEHCGVVPVAFGIEEGVCDLPWLVPMREIVSPSWDAQQANNSNDQSTTQTVRKDRLDLLYFKDPREYLSLGQLKLLRDAMAEFRNTYKGIITTAVINFQEDIEADIRALEAKNPYLIPESKLLLGLLLRNTEDMGLRVVQNNHRSVQFDNPPRLCKLSGKVCESVQHLVLLNHSIIAYLDGRSILYSVNPTATLMAAQGKSPSPLAVLNTKLDTLLQSKNGHYAALKGLIQNQLARLRADFGDTPLLEELEKQYPAQISAADIILPWKPIGSDEHKAKLSDSKHSALALQVNVQENPSSLFSPVLMYYEAGFNYPQEENERAVIRINQHGENTLYAFQPLGIYGGIALVHTKDFSVTIVAIEGGNNLALKATIRVKDRNLIYEASQEYRDDQLRKLDAGKLPCLALWADVQESEKEIDRQWQLYYVFACFPPDVNSMAYQAEVYDHKGRMVPAGNQVSRSPYRDGKQMWWRIYRMDEKPGFIVYLHNGIPAGIIKLQPKEDTDAKLLFQHNTRMQLAIDFGTTASIAATRQGKEAPVLVQGLDNNRMTWLLNKSEGITFADHHFISGQLFSGSGRATLVPTIVQRFDHRHKNEWPFGEDVHIDGNIHYPLDFNAPDSERKNIYSGFKILLSCDRENDMDAVKTHISNTRIFIKQMLHMYLLMCRTKDVSHLDVYFAMPLAFTGEEKEKLTEILRGAVVDVAAKAGLSHDIAVSITTESRAVGTYFKQTAMNSLDYDGVFTLDIGGGTSDYSVWERDSAGIAATVCCSNRLAGNEMFAALLYEELITNQEISILPSALEKIQLPEGMSDTYFKSLISMLRSIKPNESNSSEMVTRYVDRLFIQYSDQMEQALNSPDCKRLLGMINLQLALLFWIGRLVFGTLLTKSVGKTTKPVTICLAGNGANFYRLLSPAYKNGLIEVFENVGTPLSVFLRRDRQEQKTEVVQGLLMDDSIFQEPENDERKSLGKLDSRDVWERLLKMLQAYADVFTKDVLADPIASDLGQMLNNPAMVENLQANVYKNAGSLEMLNRHLLPLKRQLLDHLGDIQAENNAGAYNL